MNAIRRQPGTPVARGELTLDRDFARRFLNWRANGPDTDKLSDTDLLIQCARALNLDLICLQSEEITPNGPGLPVSPSTIGPIADEGLFVFWIVNGAFQTAMARQGMMAFLGQIADSPDDVRKLLRHISGQVVATMATGVAAGAHGIILAEDIAYHQSTYISPDFVEQHLLPIWQAQVTAARDLGVPVFLHSDGNLNAVLPYIAAAGFDGLQCIEPAAGMDVLEIKASYGQNLCLMGNIDPALLCDQGHEHDTETPHHRLRRAVFDLMAAAGDDGGFIFGTCSGLHAGMSPELAQYMYDLVSEIDTNDHGMSS